MPKVLLDATLANQLQSAAQSVELCDPSGRVLGRFVPVLDLSKWEPLTPEISEQELKRRLRSNEAGYSTAEVLAHLEKL